MSKNKSLIDHTGEKNPYITKSISKSLLTPCRQMGLSRNRKTPNSLSKTLSSSSDKSSSNSQTAPDVPSFTVNAGEVQESKKPEKAVKNPTKRTVAKCLIPDEFKPEEATVIVKCSPVKNSTLIPVKESTNMPTNSATISAAKKTKEEKAVNLDHQLNTSRTVLQDKINISSKLTSEKVAKKKTLMKSLSMKKTSSDEDEEFSQPTKKLKVCTVKLEQIHIQDVNVLKKELQDQVDILEELKQAEIYQKQHNVKQVAELSETWKRGCIKALNDLLQLVRTRVDTDMETLLNKLKMPTGLLTLTPDGELV